MTAERRLPLAIGASLLVNAVAWTAVGAAAAYRVVAPLPPIEFQRVIVTQEGKKTVKVVKPEEVKKKVEKIVKERRPTPPPKPVEPRHTEPKPVAKSAPPPPPGAHNKVLTAKPSPAAPSKPQDFTALADGNAPQGKPTETQAPGSATTNPPNPPKTEPPPAPKTEAKPTADPGPKADPPKADPPPVAPTPPPKVDPPKKKGPTRDAQHSNEVNPSIPDDLKTQEFKKFVRLKVEIAADGSFTVTLRTSSGNEEVDRRVLDALKKWTWKPKLVDGEPVDSTQLFRFDFEVK